MHFRSSDSLGRQTLTVLLTFCSAVFAITLTVAIVRPCVALVNGQEFKILVQRNGAFDPSKQKPLVARSKEFSAHLLKKNGELSIKLMLGTKTLGTVPLPTEIAQADGIEFVRGNKIAVLGRVNGDVNAVAVLSLDTVALTDHFYCYSPSLSPDRRFVAYIKFFPAHFVGEVSDVYLVYDFLRSSGGNRPNAISENDRQNVGSVIYPSGVSNRLGDNTEVPADQVHMLASGDMSWAPHRDYLAFADCYKGVLSLVVINANQPASPTLVRRLSQQNVSSNGQQNANCGQAQVHWESDKEVRITIGSRSERVTVNLIPST